MNYVLQLPSGASYQFTDWPDFTVSKKYINVQQRVAALNRKARIVGVGEVESPITSNKTKAYAQAGIYAVEQLGRLKKKVATVILFKDKTAQVLS